MNKNKYLIETKNLSKSYGAIHAVKNVDFHLQHNEVIGLLGDNGAGKTTLIRMLSGAEKPTSGEILFSGEKVKMRSPKDAMSLGIETIHQYNSSIGTLTIAENIFLGREQTMFNIGNFGVLKKTSMRDASEDSLQHVGFKLRSPNLEVGQLSGGQRQGVAIARALHFQSKIMILDEPTNHISVKETNNVIKFAKSLPKRNYSGIFISHNLNHVLEVCSRVVVMARGQVVADRPADKLSIEEIEALL